MTHWPDDEFDALDATALADAVRTGRVDAATLVARSLERIDTVDPRLNAVTWRSWPAACDLEATGPFAGVPILLKDTMAEAVGQPMHSGARVLADFVGAHDGRTARRLRAAGFVIVGRTNMPEFGLLPTTEPDLHGPCANPHGLRYTAGGSSGGSAAAVAARLVHIAHATDGGGSTRIPAACCSLFGLKPSRARVPLSANVVDALGGVTGELGVTKSVRDTAALLDILSDVGHPSALAELDHEPPPLRVALLTRVLGDEADDELVNAAERVRTALGHAGHRLVQVPALPFDVPDVAAALRTFYAMSADQTLHGVGTGRGRAVTSDEVEPHTWALATFGSSLRASQRLQSLQTLRSAGETMNAEFMRDVDVLVVPTLVSAPVPIGTIHGGLADLAEVQRRRDAFAANTALFNVTGQPAINVPAGLSTSGLPVGIQLIARVSEDNLLLRIVRQLELVGFVPTAAP